MTSIVTLLAGPFVQMAGDRLVTVRGLPYDRLANKTIVFVARDAVACVGYTGAAYIGAEPTDHFIARQLAGRPLVAGLLTLTSNAPEPPPIGNAVVALIRALNAAAIPTRHSPAIMISGWRWRTRRGRNFDRGSFTWMVHRAGPGEFHFDRYRPAVGTVKVSGIPTGRLKAREVDAYLDALVADTTHDLGTAELLLAGLVRQVADRARAVGDQTVGRDVMVVTLPPPYRDRTIRVRFLPDPSEPLTSTFGGYSPWLIAPGVVVAPADLTPTWRFQSGAFTFQLVGTPTPGRAGGQSSPRRPPR